MLLGPISYVDCLVFVVFLIPQLLIRVGIYHTAIVAIQTLPLLVTVPITLIRDRLLTPRSRRCAFVQQATLFEDLVIRCVRHAFTNIPAWICRVFFHKSVALPFIRFRMLRHGYLGWPMKWREVKRPDFDGIWVGEGDPDVLLFYAHGGGFSMGSSFFYLEFLMTWLSLLKEAGFKNPALLSVEYSLVPDACHPVQLRQTTAAYHYAASMVSPSKICVAGDSAGGTLVLSMLLRGIKQPGIAMLISPWTTLVSSQHRNTASDYLDADMLHCYARQYVGDEKLLNDPIASPGTCRDEQWWQRAAPLKGFFFLYGAEEVFAPEIRDLIQVLRKTTDVGYADPQGGMHAWPVAFLFLKDSMDDRQRGLRIMVREMQKRLNEEKTREK